LLLFVRKEERPFFLERKKAKNFDDFRTAAGAARAINQ
jgi:hypothetical protein